MNTNAIDAISAANSVDWNPPGQHWTFVIVDLVAVALCLLYLLRLAAEEYHWFNDEWHCDLFHRRHRLLTRHELGHFVVCKKCGRIYHRINEN